MYNNKKIVTLINANIFEAYNDAESVNFASANPEFFRLYKLPDPFGSVADYEDYVNQNSINFPHQSHYRWNQPYTEKRALYQSLMHDERNLFCNLLNSYNTFNNGIKSSRVNEKIPKHHSLHLFEYNWEAHKLLLDKNDYIPIYIDDSSDMHQHLYYLYLRLSPEEELKVQQCIENYTLVSPEDVVFIFWKKNSYIYNFNQEDENSHKIYSNISYGVFSLLKESILNYNVSEDSFHFKNPQFSHTDYDTISNNRAWWRNRDSLRKLLKDRFTLGNSWDIFFFKNTSSAEYFTDLVNANSKKKLKVLKAPSWKTKSSDKEVSITYYTKNQCLKRQISFMPYMNKYTLLIDKDTTRDINYFSLVSSGDFLDLKNVSRALRKFVEVLELISWKDGIKLSDPEKVKEIYKEMYSG